VIQAVLFDLDGTLVDSERETAEAMARALARGQGVQVDQEDRDYIIGRSWIAIYDRLKNRYGFPWTREEVFAEVGITVLPGAREAVARFADVGRALVTGSARVEAMQALKALGMIDTFVPMVCAEDVTRSKPAPDGYLAAVNGLALRPEQCVVVEDSAAGISAGRAAGCVVIGVRAGNFDQQDQSAAHRVIDTLEELTPDLVGQVAQVARSSYGGPR